MWKAVVALLLVLALLCGVGAVGAGGWWYWTQRAVATSPDNTAPDEAADDIAAAVDHMAVGQAAYTAGDHETALREFDAAVQANPRDGVALSWRGRTYAQLGMLDRAEPDLEDAARRLATDLETWRSLGWVRTRQSDDEGAVTAYDEAIKLAGTDARLYVERGNALFRLGLRARALDDATRACELGDTTGCTLRDRIHAVSGG